MIEVANGEADHWRDPNADRTPITTARGAHGRGASGTRWLREAAEGGH